MQNGKNICLNYQNFKIPFARKHQMSIVSLYEMYLESVGISTDTRKIRQGSMFFALKGNNFNANTFAKEALEKGAKYIVIDDSEYQIDHRCILVKDSLTTLQALASHHRKQFNIPFIAITGSNGKTTTKELTNALLSKKYNVLATKGNLNNHIGVPLTLLSIDQSVEIAIIEMGANHLGEITALCNMARPTHGVITNIGRAHIGEFGSVENIIRTKGELYHYLMQNKGQVWINSNHCELVNMGKQFVSPSFYPNKKDDYTCELLSASPFITYRSMNGKEIRTQLIGQYNFENIATALAIGHTFEVKESVTNKAISDYRPDNNRSQVTKKGSNTYILDAYNANPSSMEVAIENISQIKARKKVLILGDMYELGSKSDEEHKRLGKLLQNKDFTQVYFCGTIIKVAMESFPKGKFFPDKKTLANHIKQQNFTNTLFLLKASRKIGLEQIMEII